MPSRQQLPPEVLIANAIRAGLEAVLPDPDRSEYINRLNERFGDGTVPDQQQPKTALVSAQPSLAAGGTAIVVSYVLPNRIGRAFVTRWWHDIRIAGSTDPADAETAWPFVFTDILKNGVPLRGLDNLRGQRTDPLAPGVVAVKLAAGQEFAIRMSVGAGYVGPNVLCNAFFSGHTA